MLRAIRQHLGWKLFLSYVIVILVGTAVLALAAQLAVPTAFERHMAAMADMMGGMSGMMNIDLFTNFRAAVTEALVLAATTAFSAAVILSIFVSRRVVLPVQNMQAASQRVAEGHYDERVEVPGGADDPDLDELGYLAQSFNQMAARLEQTEAMRRDLIGNVAHELRTPLSTIKGYMEALIDGVLPAEATTFQQVHREADRLQRLVHDLQQLSRVESGSLALDMKPTPVARLVAVVVKRLERQFADKDVGLEVDVPQNLPPVRADQDRIGQVMLNLVGNALQYSPPGGRVQIRARQVGQSVLIEVQDTGIGIAAEHLPHLFERFYRVETAPSRVAGGSGIGLTIAKHLVEAHGGEISASSPGLGEGATFSFNLPVT